MDTLTLEEYQDKYLDILINGIKERYQLEGEIYPLGFEDYNRGLVAMDQFTLIDENGKVFHGSLVIHEKWYQFNNGSMEIIVIH